MPAGNPEAYGSLLPDLLFQMEMQRRQGHEGYDIETARSWGKDRGGRLRFGLEPDPSGHYSSRMPYGPNEGLILKSPGHPTLEETFKAENEIGYELIERAGRLYSFPKGDPRLKTGRILKSPKDIGWRDIRSSEITATERHPTIPDRWVNFPTVWGEGSNRRILDTESALRRSAEAGLLGEGHPSSFAHRHPSGLAAQAAGARSHAGGGATTAPFNPGGRGRQEESMLTDILLLQSNPSLLALQNPYFLEDVLDLQRRGPSLRYDR